VSGPATPALAAFITLVVVLAGMTGIVTVPGKAYAGLLLLLMGLALLAWGREELGGPSDDDRPRS
jgi:hypothetical protein